LGAARRLARRRRGVAAGMTPIGFVGGSLAPGRLATELFARGARTVVADMRALKSAVTDLRGGDPQSQ
jgi:beta-phosphoglucomutase-like phosphatase (HAD superfamily)